MSESTNLKSGFAGIAKDKGSKRMLMFGGAVIALAAGWAVFGGGTAPIEGGQVAPRINNAPSSVQGTPGSLLTPVYDQALTDRDRAVAQAAERDGRSALPTPRGQGTRDTVESRVPPEETGIWRSPTPAPAPVMPVVNPPTQAPQAPQAPPPNPQVVQQQMQAQIQRDQALQQAMLQQLRSLMPGPIQPAQTQYLYAPMQQATAGASALSPNVAGLASAPGVQGPAGGIVPPQTVVSPAAARSRFVVPAPGTVLYSRLIGRVDSDVPGPVLAEVMQGPFSGSRLLGSFVFGERGVLIRFTSMTVPYKDDDGIDRVEVVPIQSVAVDTKHLGSAMATDIDRHLFERVGVAFGTAFLQGLGQAIGRAGTTVTQTPLGGSQYTYPQLDTQKQLFVGAGEAAGAAGRVMEQVYGNRRTTITVDADTPFGLLFLGSNNN